jgi:hypothetical protein
MPVEVIRCPECDRTQRYARPSLKRFARDAEGKAILKDGEPVMEMAYMCRGGHIFYHVEGQRAELPKASKRLVEKVLEEIEKNKKEKEKENA